MTKWDVHFTIDEERRVKHVVPQPTKEAAKRKVQRAYPKQKITFIGVHKVSE